MTDNYEKIVQDNIHQLYSNLPADLEANLPGKRDGDDFYFRAFGEKCTISPDGIALGDKPHSAIFSILISLYALNAHPKACVKEPFKSFKEFPDSMPYIGAFTTHTEQLMVPHVQRIRQAAPKIINSINGFTSPKGTAGDFSFVVHPLPKIALCYIFYEADEDFPASVTCLFSSNARLFLPMDGLADVGEYTGRKILDLINS